MKQKHQIRLSVKENVQEAFLLLFDAVDKIDSGRVQSGRNSVWTAIGMLLDAEDDLLMEEKNARYKVNK